MIETDDHSLLGTSFGGPIPLPVDTPNLVAPVKYLDPRKTGYYFDPTSFAASALGSQGTANRRFFHGPGLNNWDMAIRKDTHINERLSVELRFEFFNIWNHAQFATPSGILSSSFGQITSTLPFNQRIGQFGAKFNF